MQIVSVLLNESDASSAAANDGDLAGKSSTLALLGSFANAVAIGAEAGEDVDEVSAGSIDLQVTVALGTSLAASWFAANLTGYCRCRCFGRRCLSLRWLQLES